MTRGEPTLFSTIMPANNRPEPPRQSGAPVLARTYCPIAVITVEESSP